MKIMHLFANNNAIATNWIMNNPPKNLKCTHTRTFANCVHNSRNNNKKYQNPILENISILFNRYKNSKNYVSMCNCTICV